MGADDTRHMFLLNPKEGANLTAQFGVLPTSDETFGDDNTQALFAPIQHQQTCTEAFFAQIHEENNLPQPIPSNNSAVQNKDATVS